MRMWNVDVNKMCNKHLLGEHVEMHMFVGTINKNINIQGYLNNQLIEVHNIKKRHEQLAKEITKRGMNHQSPLIFDCKQEIGFVDKKFNLKELNLRCEKCLSI